MHNPSALFIAFHIGFCLFIGASIPLGIIYAVKRFNWSRQYKLLKELNDAPFPFKVRTGGNRYCAVFDLEDGMTLWCKYNFGIREDGYFGINELSIEGFNSYWNTDVELKIGQSVFPLVHKMEQFTDWLDQQPFDYNWDRDLEEKWEDMKKKLNNLRYLESKSKEKDKKQK